jgi:hypothetical protein
MQIMMAAGLETSRVNQNEPIGGRGGGGVRESTPTYACYAF